MMTITYNLQQDGTNYYYDVREITDKTLNYFSEHFNYIAAEYRLYILENNIEPLRTYEEYVYDFLSAGIYINTYLLYSSRCSNSILKIQRALYRLRRKYKFLKPYADLLRGIISTAFLYKKGEQEFSLQPADDFSKLILWLEAAGEFREEVIRLQIFLNYLKTKNKNVKNKLFTVTKIFAKWFERESLITLGIYTAGVESFIYEKHKNYRWKENYIFVGRKRLEYHLSMVGAELMNMGFKNNFFDTGKKSILVPACMRYKKEMECKAVINNFDMTCTGCSAECRINCLSKLGKEKNFSVHIIPHSSDFTKWLKTWAVGTDIGVVGVACPLNLITGGLELKSLNIPAQCVLLDYCGCNNHWDKEGFPTTINENELLKILNCNNTLPDTNHVNSSKPIYDDKACNF